MYVAISIFILVIIFFFEYFFSIKHISKIFECIFILFFIILFSSRNSSIPDTDSYLKIYQNTSSYYNNIEIGFLTYNNFMRNIGFSFYQYLIISEVILFGIWIYVTKNIFNKNTLPLIIFMSYMGLYFYGIVFRAAIATTLAYYAIYILIYKNYKHKLIIYYLIIFTTILIHQSMVLLLFIPLFAFKNIKSNYLYFILIISLIIPITGINKYILLLYSKVIDILDLNRFNNYIENTSIDNETSYALINIKYVIIGVICVYSRKYIVIKQNIYNFFMNIYILGIFILSTTYFITAGSRMAMTLLFFEFILVSFIYYYSIYLKRISFIYIIILLSLNFIALFRGTPSLINY